MSWDIFAFKLSDEFQSVDEIPKDFKPEILGERAELIERIQRLLPGADFRDPSWGLVEGESWSIEVSMGKSQQCDGFALHVRGDDGAVGAVVAILQCVGARAVDAQTGDFFVAGPETLESFQKWMAYRDRVVKGE